MFHGHLMERTNDGTLEQTESTFDGVRMHIAAHVLFRRMVDVLMVRILIDDVGVNLRFVRVDALAVVGNVRPQKVVDDFAGGPLASPEANTPATLDCAEHHRLTVTPIFPS